MIDVDKTAGCLAYRWSSLERRERERGEGGNWEEDYGGPAARGLLLEPEKVCRKSGTHSGNIARRRPDK